MKKLCAVICLATVILCGCADNSFKGFYEEDLSKYIKLGQYKGLSYEMPDISATDEEVDEYIYDILEAATEIKKTDGKVNSASTVKIDVYCFINGSSRPELSESEAFFSLDTTYEDEVVNEMIKKLVGHTKGTSISVDVTLPSGYKGVITSEIKANFRITVLEVYEKIVPTLTDDNASLVIAGCTSVSELKTEVRRHIEREKKERADDKIKSELKQEIISSSVLKKTPMAVLNEYYNDLKALYEGLSKAQGMTLYQYIEKNMNMSESEFEAMLSERASKESKEALVLYSIVKIEGIECNDKLLFSYASEMAERSQGIFASGEDYLNYYGKNAVTEDYLWNEVLDLAYENGEPTVK